MKSRELNGDNCLKFVRNIAGDSTVIQLRVSGQSGKILIRIFKLNKLPTWTIALEYSFCES